MLVLLSMFSVDLLPLPSQALPCPALPCPALPFPSLAGPVVCWVHALALPERCAVWHMGSLEHNGTLYLACQELPQAAACCARPCLTLPCLVWPLLLYPAAHSTVTE